MSQDKYNWMDTLPDASSGIDDWFSEHDYTQGDGFEYARGPHNEVVGINIDRSHYQRHI